MKKSRPVILVYLICHPRESEDPDLNNVLNLIYELDPRFREDDKLGKFVLIQRIAETSLEGALLARQSNPEETIMRVWIASRRPLRGCSGGRNDERMVVSSLEAP